MARNIDAAIAERARTQLGLLTIEEARELGLTDRMRRRRIASGTLVAVGERTLRLAGVPPSWEVRLLGACLEAGPNAGASHLSAGAMWGLRRMAPGAFEVAAPRSRSGRSVPAVVHRSRYLPDTHLTVRDQIPVTSAERTLADLSSRLTYSMLEGCLDDALRRNLVSRESMAEMIQELRRRGRRGIPRLAGLLDDPATGGATTKLERRFVSVVEASGLPMPELQAPVVVRGRTFFLDGLYRAEWVGIELDGHGTHATRRERQHDRERAALIAETGVRLLEFTNEDVWERPRYVVTTIRRHLRLAGASRRPSSELVAPGDPGGQ